MKTSAEILFQRMELLYENLYNLVQGFQKATTTSFNEIQVPIKNETGIVTNVTINSFQRILQDLARLDNNFKTLTNDNNISYIVHGDGSLSQTTKTSFINAEYLSKFNFADTCIIDKSSIINDLIYPNVKIPITIDSKLKSDIRCIIYDITNGWDKIPDDATILNIKYLMDNGIVQGKESTRILNLEKEQVSYYGEFTVLNVLSNNNEYTINLSDIQYRSINSIGNSIDLKENDILVNNDGTSRFKITYINKFDKIIKCIRISGSGTIKNGVNQLMFNETLKCINNIVGVPVQPSKKLAVFLSTENLLNVGFPSNIIKIDTSDYKVVYDNKTYSLDEFFTKYVTNFSEYLSSLLQETTIPISLGIVPNKPVLDLRNFKVVQINKHLTTAKTTEEINALNQQKQKVLNDIDYKESLAKTLQAEVDTLKFASVEERNYSLNRIISLRNEIITLNQNLLTISRKIDTNALQYGLKDFKPKYKIIGFWDVQEPIYSPQTKPQNIIKYEIQYRYLSRQLDTVENTSMKMISKGKEISVAFSAWNELPSRTLNKVTNINGDLVWETPIMDSVEDININQLAASINEGESIELKVRALSEAGYPISPLKSEWSEIIRIDFPEDIVQNNVTATIAKNETDLSKAEFNAILQASGIFSHINGTIKESEKTFHHAAKDIASGQYTNEQKNIPLDTVIQEIYKKLDVLQKTDVTNNILIQVIDFKNDIFTVKNNNTISLNAGNYTDNINLLNKEKFGTIIKKQGFIKIRNNNLIPIELKSLVPGTILNQDNAFNYYNVPIKSETGYQQKSKQIIYFRNIDITGANDDVFKLVKQNYPKTSTLIEPNLIDNSIVDADKNLVYIENNIVKICKLKQGVSGEFICFTKEHPKFDFDDKQLMYNELIRLSNHTKILKERQWQNETSGDSDTVQKVFSLNFDDNDKYSVGKNSCGAFLYPLFPNQNNISVVGNTTISTLIIQKESEILIPFIYEYRMVDRLGNVDGVVNNESLDFEYMKKIGIDILINNELFKFDIEVSSKLRSKVSPIENINVNSIMGKYNSENKDTLK